MRYIHKDVWVERISWLGLNINLQVGSQSRLKGNVDEGTDEIAYERRFQDAFDEERGI